LSGENFQQGQPRPRHLTRAAQVVGHRLDLAPKWKSRLIYD
jgi:hypothetical protein